MSGMLILTNDTRNSTNGKNLQRKLESDLSQPQSTFRHFRNVFSVHGLISRIINILTVEPYSIETRAILLSAS